MMDSLIFGSSESVGQTIALLATFLGIGILVNVLIAYIIGEVLVERRANQERLRRQREQATE